MRSVPQITVILSGGALGSDPWHPQAWSGSSLAVLEALERAGALKAAHGLQLPAWQFGMMAFPRYHRNREIWRRRVYRSTRYRQALTARLSDLDIDQGGGGVCLQFGAYADSPSVLKNIPVLTYQDGAAVTYDESPFVPEVLRRDTKLQQEALAFEQHLARSAARVLTTSQWLADRMQEAYDLKEGHALRVGCGHAQQTLAASPEDHDYSCADILFIGVEFERKGGPSLLTAFEKIREVHPTAQLHIVGPREKPSGCDTPGIIWHGYLSRNVPDEAQNLNTLFRKCSLFVLPSRYEPFGMAPIEAMANGLPAIVTGEWALKENIRNGIDGVHVRPDDPEHLAETLTQLLNHPSKLAEMGYAASQSPARQTWDEVAENILQAAENALKTS